MTAEINHQKARIFAENAYAKHHQRIGIDIMPYIHPVKKTVKTSHFFDEQIRNNI
jgi:hypothetical protein